ncbi:hypothetical protein GWK47_030955 [Chionoecetes opilio]|uniref:Uncharacterized protein n=1 Tax=Chionoecetes opilio TaxID=41210 RepID=A0A8J4YRE6_CHIOP|nr:hypothetical protein GWK47_030955 [Chionoecetes opilio]
MENQATHRNLEQVSKTEGPEPPLATPWKPLWACFKEEQDSSPDQDEEDDFFKARLIDLIEIYCIFSLEGPRTHSYRGQPTLPAYLSQRNKLLEQAIEVAVSDKVLEEPRSQGSSSSGWNFELDAWMRSWT